MAKQLKTNLWNETEDQLLVETVLSYTRTGKTMIEAFEDISEALNRTPAACGFRWNSTLKPKFQKEFDNAKVQRVSNKRDQKKKEKEVIVESADQEVVAKQPVRVGVVTTTDSQEREVTLESVFNDIKSLLNGVDESENVVQENETLKEENQMLKAENEKLREEKQQLAEQITKIQSILGPIMNIQ